jgi:hypothetical protein
MSDSTADNFFTARHTELTRFASITNLVAWLVFIVHILWVWAAFLQAQNGFGAQSMNINIGQHPDLMAMAMVNPIYTASLIASLTGLFLRGVVYALTLKGISLGLNMIVETNLNVIENRLAGQDE